MLPPVLLNLRTSLFPNNTMGPPAPPPPSLEERLKIRRKAAESILSLVPPLVVQIYFSTKDSKFMIDQIEKDLLDPFGDVYLNKHLVYGILELILVKLVPELTESGVTELFAERGVIWANNDVDIGAEGEVAVDNSAALS